MDKGKEFCILDENNNFVDIVKHYPNPKKLEDFGVSEQSLDIPKPDLELIQNGHTARWDFEKENWIYTDHKSEEKNIHTNPNPMFYFRMARNNKLNEIDEYIIKKIQNGTYKVGTKLLQYKEDIYNLPEKIQNKDIEPPVLNSDISEYKKTKNPEDMIIFNWPTYKFRE